MIIKCILLPTLVITFSAGYNVYPHLKCPKVAPKNPEQCKGQRSTCWSPGVEDIDCPNSGSEMETKFLGKFHFNDVFLRIELFT